VHKVARPVQITAAVDGRANLSIVIVDTAHWAVFDADRPDVGWLGEITAHTERFLVSHEDGVTVYSFPEFCQAISYFMEYGFVLAATASECS
jgi:hypothetical protein